MPSSLHHPKSYISYLRFFLPVLFFSFIVSFSFSEHSAAEIFYPLEIGNEWTNISFFSDDQKKEAANSKVFIATKPIGINSSFRYPEKDLLHPSLSPHDEWLVYRKLSIFSKMGNIISSFLDTTYKKMYYSKIGQSRKILLPLPARRLDDVGYRIEWSQDGKVLALSAKIDNKSSIILFDFSGSKPRLVEYFEAEDIFHWTVENVLLYSHSSGNIMTKVPGKVPEKAVFLGEGQRAYDFQLADNGTVLFIIGSSPSWKVYKTNLQNPEHRTLIFESEMTPEFIISGDGQFALVSTRKREKPDYWSTKLYDLNTNIVKLELATYIRNARFSPDGSKLAFKEVYDPSKYTFKEGYNPSKHRITQPHFFVLDLKTKDVCDYGYGIDKHFNWTPDGNHIIYSMKCIHQSGVYENGIFVVRISDGKEVAKLTSINSIGAPRMSRSGKYIVWEGADMNTFFIVGNPLKADAFPSR